MKTSFVLAGASILGIITAMAAQSPPVFRTGVEVVEIAVLARDGDGRLVGDLAREDFQVIEDGAPQSIVAFEHVSLPVVHQGPAGTPRPAPPPVDVADNDVSPDARLFVIVLDALHIEGQRTLAVRRKAAAFIEEHMGPSDLAAVVSPGARPEATQEFTSDKVRLLAAIEQFQASKLRSATIERYQDRLGSEMRDGRDPNDEERAYHATAVAGALESLARHLARVETRRKALLFFSEGIDYNTTDIFGKFQRRASDVAKAFERPIGALARANVVVYSIDPRGLSGADASLVESPIYQEAPSAVDVIDSGVQGELSASIRSLRDIAERTGGFATDANDLRDSFDRIVREVSDYYVLGYVPARRATPGEFRNVEVRVSRPGVHVVARKGYTGAAEAPRTAAAVSAEPELTGPFGGRAMGRSPRPGMMTPEAPAAAPKGLADGMNDLLASPLPKPGLPLRVTAIPFRGDGKKTMMTVIIEIGAKGLSFTERGGRFLERVELAQITVDSSARADNGRSTSLDLRLTPQELEGVRATGVRRVSRLELKPGHYQLRVAGRAQGSEQTGMVIYDMDVPRFESGRLAMSGVALTSLPSVLMVTRSDAPMPATLGTPPSAVRAFMPGDRVTAVVELYAPASAGEVVVTARVETPDGTSKMRAARRVAGGAAKERREEVSFTIPTASLASGQYVLHLTAQPQAAGGAIERRVPFEVVGAAP